MADQWYWAGGLDDNSFTGGPTTSGWAPQSFIYGAPVTLPTGHATKLAVRAERSDSNAVLKLGLYNSSGTKVADVEGIANDLATPSWLEGTISVDVTAGTYYVMVSSSTDRSEFYYNTGSNVSHGEAVAYASAMPASITWSQNEDNIWAFKVFVEDNTQAIQPASDHTDGTWSPSTGTDNYAVLDEQPASDTDFSSTNSNSTLRVNLGSPPETVGSGTRTLSYRISGSPESKVVVRLIQGTTTKETFTHDGAPGSITQFDQTVTASITDYTDLDLEVEVADASAPQSAAVTFGASGSTPSSGSTSCTPNYPTGINASTSDLWCYITSGASTQPTPTMPAGWTEQFTQSGGSGETYGAGVGNRRVTLFKKDTVTGSETGTVTVSLTNGNTMRATIFRTERPAGTTISLQSTYGTDATEGTAWSATGGSLNWRPNQLLLVGTAQSEDTATQSSQAVSASGVTFGTITNRQSVAVGTGSDHRHVLDSIPVNASNVSAAPTWTHTNSEAASGLTAFFLLSAYPTEKGRITWTEFRLPIAAGPVTHATSGAPASQAATLAGTAAHIAVHAAEGALAVAAAVLAATAFHSNLHTTTGDLTAQTATLEGTAARFRAFATTGTPAAQAATLAGTAARALTQVTHVTDGTPAAQAATAAGTAARTRVHATSGAAPAQAATLAGTANHSGFAITHVSSGGFAGLAGQVAGQARRAIIHVTAPPGGPPSGGNTIFAASPALSAVQAAVSQAVNGDTVSIPAGSATWTGQLNLGTKAITLAGAGIGQTNITNNWGGGFQTQMLTFTQHATIPTRLTGISFLNGSYARRHIGGSGNNYTTSNLRIDHCRFASTTADNAILLDFFGGVKGVIDHCTIEGANFAETIHNWGIGAAAWADDISPGTDQALYVEDCTFVNNARGTAQQWNAMSGVQSYDGARVVIRYCSFTDCQLDVHGGANIGTRWFEFYENTFNTTLAYNWVRAMDIRAGSGVVFNNHRGTDVGGVDPDICFRGECRAGDTQYRVGEGINRVHWSPAYSWGNGASLPVTFNNESCGSAVVQPGINFIDSATQPASMKRWQKATDTSATTYSYSPYTYPHPATAAGETVGSITAQSAVIAGEARRNLAPITHTSSGAASSQAAQAAGTAQHVAVHPTTGTPESQAAQVAGTAQHIGPPVEHACTGDPAAQASSIAGTALHVGQLPITPVFVAEYEDVWNTATSPRTIMSGVAVNNKDVLIALAASEDFTGGAGLVFTETGVGPLTSQAAVDVGSFCEIEIASTVLTLDKNITITLSNSASRVFGGTVLRFNNSSGVGASAAVNSASGNATVEIQTQQDNSAVAVIVGDWTAQSGARTWASVNGFAPTTGNGGEKTYQFVSGAYTVYVAIYPDAGAAGLKTVGLTAPINQKYSVAAVEIMGATAAVQTHDTSGTLPAQSAAMAGTAARVNAAIAEIGFGYAGQVAFGVGGGSATPSYPPDLRIGDKLVCLMGMKSLSGFIDPTMVTPDWNVNGAFVSGPVEAAGENTGTVYVKAWSKDATGFETGNVSISLPAALDIAWGVILRVRCPTSPLWHPLRVAGAGPDDVGDANFLGEFLSLDWTRGDVIFGIGVTTGDIFPLTIEEASLNSAGVTFMQTFIPRISTTQGFNIGGLIVIGEAVSGQNKVSGNVLFRFSGAPLANARGGLGNIRLRAQAVTNWHLTAAQLQGQAAQVSGTASHGPEKHGTGTLAAQAAAVAGTVQHIHTHITSGAITAQGAALSGTVTHRIDHSTAGALAAQASVVSGVASRFVVDEHPGAGAVAAGAAALSGTARLHAAHQTTGDLSATAAHVAATAAHIDFSPHIATGALAAQGSRVAGAALILPRHDMGGSLVATSAQMGGTALRIPVGGLGTATYTMKVPVEARKIIVPTESGYRIRTC